MTMKRGVPASGSQCLNSSNSKITVTLGMGRGRPAVYIKNQNNHLIFPHIDLDPSKPSLVASKRVVIDKVTIYVPPLARALMQHNSLSHRGRQRQSREGLDLFGVSNLCNQSQGDFRLSTLQVVDLNQEHCSDEIKSSTP
jgi:hypothetical protein